MLARITKTYGGLEGRRVKAGTVFAVEKPQGDLPVITKGRFTQLQQSRLAEAYDPNQAAAPGAKPAPKPQSKPAPTPANKVEPPSQPPRQRARRRAQADAPKEPRPLGRRGGSPDGNQVAQPSSSQEVRQAGSVTLKQRGTRRASTGSQSTTPTASSPGDTSSTPATPAGGVSITKTPADDSAAFE